MVAKVSIKFCICLASVLFVSGCDSETGRVEELVRSQLKDPDSAKFREITKKADGQYFCGEVNAKNSMGGYTGYQPFVVGPMNESLPDVVFDVSSVMDRCLFDEEHLYPETLGGD